MNITKERQKEFMARALVGMVMYNKREFTDEECEVYNSILRLIESGVPKVVTSEWFRKLFEAMIYQEGTNEPAGIIQPVAKAMLYEKGIEVQP